MILCALAWSGEVWGNNTSVSGTSLNSVSSDGKSFSWGGSHVSFKLSGSGISYYGTYKALWLSWNTSYKLSWTVNSACTINVTDISLYSRTSMEGYLYLDGTKSNNLYHGDYKPISTGTISKGNDDFLAIVTSNNTGFLGAKPNFFINQISITYTITPDAPVANPTTETVSVTLDTNNPQEVNLSSYFSSTALSSDSHFGSLSYTTSGGGTISNGKFYATSAGTYTVKAYLAAQDNCHNRSSDSNALTITVNRRTGSIVAKNGPFSMTAKNTMDLSSCISSSSGTGAISYEVTSSNKNSAVISGSNFTPSASGTYTIKATKAQDSQYATANTTFNVTVNKIQNTLTVSDRALKVDETTAGYANKNNLDTEIQPTINNVVYYDEAHNQGTGVISYNKSENKITALNAGTAELRIYQEATDAYEGFDKTVTVTVTKHDQTISWNNEGEIDTNLKVDDTPSVTATANSGLSVSYSSDDTSVLTINSTTGAITAVGAGTATVTVSQAGNYKYNAATSITKTFTITKYDQTLSWKTTDFTILPTEMREADVAVSDSKLQVTYESEDESVIKVDATTGRLVGLKEGTSTITASQAGNYKYNAATSITHIFTVSKKQPTFTPAWGESTSVDIKVGVDTSIGLTNIDESFTYSASPTGIITVTKDGNTLNIHAATAGTTTLTLTQPSTDILSKTITPYTITVSKYPNSFAIASVVDREMSALDTWEDVVTNWGLGKNLTSVSYSSPGIVTFNPETNNITANAAGETTVTFSQATTDTYLGAEKKVKIKVNRIVNTLSVTPPSFATEVGETILAGIANRNNTGTDIVATITTDSISPIKNANYGVISYANGVITAWNAGRAKIKFSQEETGQYTGYESEEYVVSVSKKKNTITITELDGSSATNIRMKYNETASLKYTYTNTDTSPVVSHASGNYTTYSSTSSASGTISSGSSPGTDIYEIRQSETYKYEAGYASFTIRVNNTDESVGYVLNESTEYSHGWGSGVVHTYTLSGPGETIFYSARTQTGAIYYHLYVEYSTDNQNWTEAQDNQSLSDSYKDFSCSIPEEARYVRFRYPAGGTLSKYLKDVKVTRKTYVRASSNITNLGTLYTDQTATATITVNYSTTNGGNITVTSKNGNFSLSPTVKQTKTATLNVDDNSDGTKTFTVTYTPDPDNLCTESTTINIGDEYNSSESITLTATSQKYETTIARATSPATTATTVDGSISNVFAFSGTTTAKPSDNPDDDFYYAISHTQTSSVNNGSGVISYDPTSNTVTGLNQGTARLTIYQKKTLKYHETSQYFDFSVSKLDNNVSIALSSNTLDVDGTATVTLTNDVSKGDLTVAYSDVTYTNELQNREGGFVSLASATKTLTAVNAGTGTVTITQAETYKYKAKSKDFTVTIKKLSQTLTWDNPHIASSMQKGTILSGNTATSSVGLTPVTYESDNIAAITVDASTGVLKAVGQGSGVTITARQAGNYMYLPASLTRQFSVFDKEVPVFTPDESFSGTSGQIEYTGTATITVSGVSDGDDFSITGYDGNVISVVRDNETITITGLALGNTVLTLAQQGNDDFIAKTQTYNIEVYWPDDFLALSSSTSPSYTEDTYRKVFFNNTLKSGYSTIALPFNTTVEDIVGTGYDEDDDWVAQLAVVTYNSKDGYSLYFEKKSDIVANQPYILHLGTAVNSPVFTNVSVVAAATAAQYTTKGVSDANQWVLHSNYNPTFDMEGYYGVVGEKIKKGAEGSSLKAYHAYIEGPTAAAVKAAYLDEDEADGLLEVLKGEGLITERVYDLQGRQLPRAGKGINIIRNADGTVRKELNIEH